MGYFGRGMDRGIPLDELIMRTGQEQEPIQRIRVHNARWISFDLVHDWQIKSSLVYRMRRSDIDKPYAIIIDLNNGASIRLLGVPVSGLYQWPPLVTQPTRGTVHLSLLSYPGKLLISRFLGLGRRRVIIPPSPLKYGGGTGGGAGSGSKW